MWKQPVFAVVALLVGSCSDGCGANVLVNAGSPNGRLSAILFERSCGATTGHSTQVSILRSGVLPANSGNTFVADTNHGAADADLGGRPWAELVWINDNHLVVRYDAQARVFVQQPEVSGVRITYQPIER
jgi:hypothetical protein